MKNNSINMRTFLCLFFAFCVSTTFAQSISGSKNVVKENRNHTNFTAIEVEDGVDVYIAQGDAEEVTVKADDNLIELIKTEVRGNTLYISSVGRIHRAKAFDVYVTVKDLNLITARDGSDVYSLTKIQVNELSLDMKGGSDLEMEVSAQKIDCALKGGSDAKLEGDVHHLIVDTQGGSDLSAKRLITQKCELVARGGSDASVNVKEELDVKAYGGSDVHYYGEPKLVHQKAKGDSDIYAN